MLCTDPLGDIDVPIKQTIGTLRKRLRQLQNRFDEYWDISISNVDEEMQMMLSEMEEIEYAIASRALARSRAHVQGNQSGVYFQNRSSGE